MIHTSFKQFFILYCSESNLKYCFPLNIITETEKNRLPPFAMERLGSTCSYGNNDSRFKIWSYTFYHFRSYSTWKKAAISVHCMMEIHHRIFHRFFHSKNGTKSSRATAETAERQEKLQGSESFLFSLHFLAIKRGGLYVQKNEPLLSQTSDRWYRRVSRPYFPVCNTKPNLA